MFSAVQMLGSASIANDKRVALMKSAKSLQPIVPITRQQWEGAEKAGQ